jgi:hypothetical protein
VPEGERQPFKQWTSFETATLPLALLEEIGNSGAVLQGLMCQKTKAG